MEHSANIRMNQRCAVLHFILFLCQKIKSKVMIRRRTVVLSLNYLNSLSKARGARSSAEYLNMIIKKKFCGFYFVFINQGTIIIVIPTKWNYYI